MRPAAACPRREAGGGRDPLGYPAAHPKVWVWRPSHRLHSRGPPSNKGLGESPCRQESTLRGSAQRRASCGRRHQRVGGPSTLELAGYWAARGAGCAVAGARRLASLPTSRAIPPCLRGREWRAGGGAGGESLAALRLLALPVRPGFRRRNLYLFKGTRPALDPRSRVGRAGSPHRDPGPETSPVKGLSPAAPESNCGRDKCFCLS